MESLKHLITPFLDPKVRNVATRLTIASLLAVSLATASGLDYPWWAAMAVWMIGQPPKGLLLERSFAQFTGTLLGAVAGALLVYVGETSIAAGLVGLVAWIAICCGVANAMRHQRAYGAALCGLTSVVIVALTLDTSIDPAQFAAARVLDTLIGVASAVGVSILLGPPAVRFDTPNRVEALVAQVLELIGDALVGQNEQTVVREREFLISLAALEGTAEDAAAGSLEGRRQLNELNALFALLLDLIVLARAIRSREGSPTAPGHAELAELKDDFDGAAITLRNTGMLDIQSVNVIARRLEATDPILSPVLEELRTLLVRAADGFGKLSQRSVEGRRHVSLPHPDLDALRLGMLRGAVATTIAGSGWYLSGWEPLRYLLLGTGIFVVLFSMVDEPARAVRQILIGGLAAVVPAALWRLGVIPEVSTGWISLLLAVPLLLGASFFQARPKTQFVGLAFNMLFIVLARPVDISQSSALVVVTNEAMLIVGIALNYALFRWTLPMNSGRRMGHLRASICREIHAISARAGTPLAERHLGRLRYLVFSVAVRSRGQVQQVEEALAALSLGHALVMLGESNGPSMPTAGRLAAEEALRLMRAPLHNPADVGKKFMAISHTVSTTESSQAARCCWLLKLAARELRACPAAFTTPALKPRRMLRA